MKSNQAVLRLLPILLLNLTGFAIAIPVLPALAFVLGGDAVDVGLLYGLQSLGQFVMAPVWGSLSDRFGRKPILLATFAAAAVAELFTAFVSSLALLYVARFLVGICAGNVATATALISDATDARNRSRGMAVVGISFGVGFTLGPALGAGVSLIAADGVGIFGAGLPFAAAAVMNILTILLGAWLIVEPTGDTKRRRSNRLASKPRSIRVHLRNTPVMVMCTLFFLYTVAVTLMEGTFFVYMARVHDYQAAEVGIIFAAMGLLMALTQGGIGRVSASLGDRAMTGLGVALLAVGLSLAPVTGTLSVLLIFLAVATIGRAFVHPGILALTSQLAPSRSDTGQIMGILQSSASLARIIGPAVGGFIFAHVHPAAPFWAAGLLLLGSGAWWWQRTRHALLVPAEGPRR